MLCVLTKGLIFSPPFFHVVRRPNIKKIYILYVFNASSKCLQFISAAMCIGYLVFGILFFFLLSNNLSRLATLLCRCLQFIWN